MMSNEQKAQEFIAAAEKKLSSGMGFLSSIFGSGRKADDAADCYQHAANLYKMEKNWNSAAQAFLSAANLHANDGCRHEAASNYVNAANCFKKNDINQAVDTLIQAIGIYTDMGRFTMAAKHHQTIAEIFEINGNVQEAVHHFEKAADYFFGEDCNSAVNKCLLKVGQYAAQLENYEKAINIYKEVAISALQSSLLKYSAKEYFFRATLCHLAVDVVNAHLAIDSYVEMFPVFQDSREYNLLRTLIVHIEEQNIDAFTETVKNYDRISCLDQWHTMMMLRIKKQLNNIPDIR